MAFPWTNLVTAASTLTAALGGASLTAFLSGRAELRRLSHERRMTRTRLRVEAYAEFLRIARADARLLALAVIRFSHGVPEGGEAQAMIDEMSQVVVDFQGALARVEVVGSEQAVRAAQDVDQAARQLGWLLRESFLSGDPVDLEAGNLQHAELKRLIERFALLSRQELAEPDSR
jgi:hypothetical protein